ncbi:MAG: hypothetical protein WCP77_02355 [Roseococcus sp.]
MLSRAPLLALTVAVAFLAAGSSTAQAQRCDTNIRVTNESSTTVTGIYYNPSSNRSWGTNRLGTAELFPRQSVRFRLGNEVPYDFRIVWVSTANAELRNTDICRISEVVVTNQGLRVR